MERTLRLTVVVAVVLSGCGAMVNGPRQQVRITTVPPGARVTVDGQTVSSPAVFVLDRGRDYTVAAEFAGFSSARAELRSRTDRAVAIGNCVLFLCIPQLWERGKPSQSRLEPSELDLTLNPQGWSPR